MLVNIENRCCNLKEKKKLLQSKSMHFILKLFSQFLSFKEVCALSGLVIERSPSQDIHSEILMFFLVIGDKFRATNKHSLFS